MYYNGAALLNAGCPINFSIGNRSIGKSFYWKRYLFRTYLKEHKKFIYLRRHENDLDMSCPNWFDDIGHQFLDYNVKYKANKFYVINYETQTEEICGYAFSLSMLHKVKSIPLEDVDFIFFDEFIPENLQYLKPLDPAYEPRLLLSLYLTVARGYKRAIRDEVRIICSANMISLFNPYFSFFNIRLSENMPKKYNQFIVNNVYTEVVTITEISNQIAESKIGKILATNIYGEYALSNKPLLDIGANIKKRPPDCRVFFELYLFKWYMCYFDNDGNNYFAEGYDKKLKRKFKAIDVEGNDILWFRGDIVKLMRTCVDNNKVFYENMDVKSALSGLLTPRIGGV